MQQGILSIGFMVSSVTRVNRTWIGRLSMLCFDMVEYCVS